MDTPLPPPEGIEIRFLADAADLPLDRLRWLYEGAGWWDGGCDDDWLRKLPAGSWCFAAAYEGDDIVGIGRAISDGAGDAYIQDVTVLRPYRHRGIARAIVSAIVVRLREAGIDWIGLVASPDSANLYRELGFSPMEGFVPMLLNDINRPV